MARSLPIYPTDYKGEILSLQGSYDAWAGAGPVRTRKPSAVGVVRPYLVSASFLGLGST